MADELDGLLGRVDDPALRADLRAHIDRIRAKRTFGLVFESHLPERVRLPEHPIRAGSRVAFRDDNASATYQVLRVRGGAAKVRKIRHPDGSRLSMADEAEVVDEEHLLDALVVVADFGEPIYPGIRRLGSIDRGASKPAQVVIEGENHHVLEALRFSHSGKVDCIYIDPPYNTGARDWKYDNNYVDDTDAYRHSKWLAFMERRLVLAQELLNPERSVLIIAIDEKEVHRLALLVHQLFPDARTQMVSAVVNPAGTSREGLARVDEYLLFVFIGAAAPARVPDNLLFEVATSEKLPWLTLIRGGSQWRRQSRPNLCYPILVDRSTAAIVGVGDPFAGDDESQRISSKGALDYAWPVRSDGQLGIWRVNGEKLMTLVGSGFAYASKYDEKRGTWSVHYLQSGTVEGIASGSLDVVRSADGRFVELVKASAKGHVAKTVWNRPSHNAGRHGSELLRSLIPGRSFPFPKSLYAVEDALRIAVVDNPNAVLLDFFGGSGTTTHAVIRLNRQDGGRRRSIVVTNNEVSSAEAESLRKKGLRPGDPEWEALGIFEHITRPRVTSAVTGLTPDGRPVKGDYKFVDEFPMAEGFEENVEFVELTYLDPDDIELDLAFSGVAPLLWLRAGATGPMIDECLDSAGRRKPYEWTERYGVLFNTDRWRGFVEKLPPAATTAFVVTDSQAIFAGVAAELPGHLDVVRLYENYLTTFRINEGLV